MVAITQNPRFYVADDDGSPLAAGKVFFYVAGSSTKQNTWTDHTGGTLNTNPVILDSRGEASVWLDPSLTYKIVAARSTDTDPPTSPIWTQDYVPSVVTPAGTETLSGKTFSDATVFTNPNSSTTGAIVLRDAAGNPGGAYIQWTNNARSSEYAFIRGVSGSIQVSGNVHPVTDNGNTLGLSTNRWSVVYAGTGTINTSDEREKRWRGGLTNAELRAGKRIIGELGFYQWLDAIDAKGDDARLHFGARAQRVWAIMADEGLVEPITNGKPGLTAYAFLCWDEWAADPGVPAAPELRDEAGEILQTATPGIPPRAAGSRFGLRLDQLTLFLVACMEARLAALEAGA